MADDRPLWEQMLTCGILPTAKNCRAFPGATNMTSAEFMADNWGTSSEDEALYDELWESFLSEPEVEEVWRNRQQEFADNCGNRSRRGRVKNVLDRKTWKVVKTYFVPGQRSHGGNDTRRFRRDDTTGKMLGGNHRHSHRSAAPTLVLTHVRVNGRAFKVGRAA